MKTSSFNYLLMNETLLYQTYRHWINYFSLRSLFTLGLLPYLEVKCEKFLITDQRVIIKKGILMIDTFEIPYSRIESVILYQPILGRIFNYGDVHIIGTGGTEYIIDTIENPNAFKQNMQEAGR